jgi:hypothetical protein
MQVSSVDKICFCNPAHASVGVIFNNDDWMSLVQKIIKITALGIVVSGLVILAGCSAGGPRPRVGSYPASSLPTSFLDINSLGSHNYGIGFGENNGLVYTAKGGHIDIAHLRIAADNTRSLYNDIRGHLLNNDSEFTFKLNVEPSSYYVNVEYPEYWKTIPDKYREKIADKLALEMSQYFAYTMTTWHEVLTWFGYKCLFFLPEFASAFSWEDIYSNLLGTRLGAEAVSAKGETSPKGGEDKTNDYNKAMTILLKDELIDLQIQSASTARQAAHQMVNKAMRIDRRKNTDIGLYDGFVTPSLAPGVCFDAAPKPLPVPTLDDVSKYGFEVSLEIHPREFKSGKILKIIYPKGGPNKVKPADHLPIVMNYIEKDAIQRGYTIVPSFKPATLVSAR